MFPTELGKAFWEKGRLDNCPILDFHGHMGDWRSCFLPRGSRDAMLRSMDQCNLQLIIFCGHEALFAPATRRSLDMDAVRKSPDRFRAYFALNGNLLDPEEDLRQLSKNRDVFVGLKMLPDYCLYPINHPIYEPFYEYAQEHHLIFLSHTWGGSELNGIAEVEKFLNRYPNIPFLAGHSFFGDWDEACRLCREYSHLYLELTAVTRMRGPLELFVEKCGSEKILFGTDLPWFDTHHAIGAILSAGLSDDDCRNIFYRNGVRLLSWHEWFTDVWPYSWEDLP